MSNNPIKEIAYIDKMNNYSFICAMAKPKDPQKIEAIFQASLQLILKEGLSGIKMGQLAKEAGLATGTLYVYFPSKEALINELYLHLKRRAMQGLLRSYAPDVSFMINFEDIWYNYMNYNLLYPEEAVFMEQYYRSPYTREEVLEERDQLLQPIFDLLERGKKERLVNSLPTTLLVSQLMGGIKELARWHHGQRLEMNPEAINQAFEMAWNSVKR